MHTHMSLFEGDVNAFHSPDDPLQLSDVGQVVHRRDPASTPPRSARSPISGSTPTSGLVRRRRGARRAAVVGCGQPVGPGPGPDVHAAQDVVATGRGAQPRLGAATPTSAFAVLLAAGLRGVEKGYVLGPQAEDNVWDL